MIAFAKRNLKLYFRDKGSVFFSLLAVFIIIGLYAFFLGDATGSELKGISNEKEIMNTWIMAGIMAITGVTTTLGMLGTMVKDKADKIMKDFYVSPVKRTHIAAGYWLSAYMVGNLMTFITFIVAEIFIVSSGGTMLSGEYIWYIVLFTLFSNLMNTSLVLFMVSLFRSMNAYASASIIVGTLIGFLTGIYIPIGSLPEAVQWAIKIFPISHSAVVYRQLMMHESMKTVLESIPEEAVNSIKEILGISYKMGNEFMDINASLLYIAAIALLFFTASCLIMRRKAV